MSQQCIIAVNKAKSPLGCTRQSVASRSREGILSLCSVLLTPHLDIASSFQPPIQERQGHMRVSPVKGHQDGQGTGAHGLGRGGRRKGNFGGDWIETSNTCKEDMNRMKAGSAQWCMR